MFESNKPEEIGKVIRILDKYTLLVNVGKSTLKVGDKIQVYESGEEIRNLDDSIIGHYVFIKDELDVVQTEDNYSICRKEKIIQRSTTSILALSPLLDDLTTTKEPLNINNADISPISHVTDKLVHIGDSVRLA